MHISYIIYKYVLRKVARKRNQWKGMRDEM